MRIAFIARFNKIYDEEGKALSLEKLGHEVFRFDENTFNTDILFNNINSVLAVNPDVVIYAKLEIPNAGDIVKQFKDNNILTVSWFPDYCFKWNIGLLKYNESCPISSADLLLIPDDTNKDKWRSLGINQQCVRQDIYDELCFIGTPIKNLNKEILFVGTVDHPIYKHRIPLINFLEKTYGDKFLHLGGNNSDEIRNSDLNDIIASVKVVIGDSLYNPQYWSNRIYETIGRGGFMLHSNIEGIDEEYEIGKHFDVYNIYGENHWGRNIDFNHLKSKIDYYLSNNIIRENIALEGMNFTKKNHTLMNRSKQVVDIITKEIKKRDWFNG
tara:strand:- start:6914 stop:7894 length:981 start_codon:yes stop_codon:yes gene_type:complete